MMATYHPEILIDQRTSWTRDEAAAFLLGRRSLDPICGNNNSDEVDPDDVYENFLEWLERSIFDELMDERNGFLMDLEEAREKKNPDRIAACRSNIVKCDDTIRRAKVIMCDIDDELTKGSVSLLRKDQGNTDGQVRITLTSLKEWAAGRDYLKMPVAVTQAQVAPPVLPSPESDEPLLNSKGGMNPKMAKGFLLTFAALLEAFLTKTGPEFLLKGKQRINLSATATMLRKQPLPCGTISDYQLELGITSIEERIKEVIKASNDALTQARPMNVKGKPKKSKIHPTDSMPSDLFNRTRSQKIAPKNS